MLSHVSQARSCGLALKSWGESQEWIGRWGAEVNNFWLRGQERRVDLCRHPGILRGDEWTKVCCNHGGGAW